MARGELVVRLEAAGERFAVDGEAECLSIRYQARFRAVDGAKGRGVSLRVAGVDRLHVFMLR